MVIKKILLLTRFAHCIVQTQHVEVKLCLMVRTRCFAFDMYSFSDQGGDMYSVCVCVCVGAALGADPAW